MIALSAAGLSAVGSVLDDLRNSLGTIHGGAEMFAGSMLSQAQAHRIARNIYAASELQALRIVCVVPVGPKVGTGQPKAPRLTMS